MYKYTKELDILKAPGGIVNIRSQPNGADIGDLLKEQIVEGDILVGADPAKQWLQAATINGAPVTQPSFIAAWLLKDATVPVDYPSYTLEVNIHSDTALVVITPDGVVHNFPSGDVIVSAENPVMKLV